MISVISTVKNEIQSLSLWLESIQSQTKQADEIVIVDGGSTDGTWEWLQNQQSHHTTLKAYQVKGNIAHGRNCAITYAKGDYIAVADAGCRYESTWLENITAPLREGMALCVTTAFGPWLQDSDTLKTRLIAASTIPQASEFKKDWYPSSRSIAFTKEVWEKAGRYPEWIPWCEDILFDMAIVKSGISIHFIRVPYVYWQPRTCVKSYMKQVFQYTKSDGHGKLFLGRQIIRYAVYIGSLVLLGVSFMYSYVFLLPLLAGLIVYMRKFFMRWISFTRDKNWIYRLSGVVAVPLIVAVGDLAKMCGWPVGVYERSMGKIKPE